MTASIVMVTQDHRPATPAELANAAEVIAGGYLDGTGNSRHTKGTLWERAAERVIVPTPRGNRLRRLAAVTGPGEHVAEIGPTGLSSGVIVGARKVRGVR